MQRQTPQWSWQVCASEQIMHAIIECCVNDMPPSKRPRLGELHVWQQCAQVWRWEALLSWPAMGYGRTG